MVDHTSPTFRASHCPVGPLPQCEENETNPHCCLCGLKGLLMNTADANVPTGCLCSEMGAMQLPDLPENPDIKQTLQCQIANPHPVGKSFASSCDNCEDAVMYCRSGVFVAGCDDHRSFGYHMKEFLHSESGHLLLAIAGALALLTMLSAWRACCYRKSRLRTKRAQKLEVLEDILGPHATKEEVKHAQMEMKRAKVDMSEEQRRAGSLAKELDRISEAYGVRVIPAPPVARRYSTDNRQSPDYGVFVGGVGFSTMHPDAYGGRVSQQMAARFPAEMKNYGPENGVSYHKTYANPDYGGGSGYRGDHSVSTTTEGVSSSDNNTDTRVNPIEPDRPTTVSRLPPLPIDLQSIGSGERAEGGEVGSVKSLML